MNTDKTFNRSIMKITKLISGKYTKGALLVIAGLILGWLFFHHSHTEEPKQEASVKEARKNIWTCATLANVLYAEWT